MSSIQAAAASITSAPTTTSSASSVLRDQYTSYEMPNLKNNNRNGLRRTSNGNSSNFVPATVPKTNLSSAKNLDSSNFDHIT